MNGREPPSIDSTGAPFSVCFLRLFFVLTDAWLFAAHHEVGLVHRHLVA